MELLDAHRHALAQFDWRVRHVRESQWCLPTPCAQWSVRELVNHLVVEQRWAPGLLRGMTSAEIGDRFDGDQLGREPVRAWTEAAGAARASWLRPRAVDQHVQVSSGLIPAIEYGWQMTLDLAVHGWDLARAIEVDDLIDGELAQALLDMFAAQVARWQHTGIIAPPVSIPPRADVRTRLIALLGRDPSWRTPHPPGAANPRSSATRSGAA